MKVLLMTVIIISGVVAVQAQTTDIPKFELGADFTTLSIHSTQTHPGVGGRITYNLNRHVAVEGAGYFSPGSCDFCIGETTGHITEGLFGVKAGHRFKKIGVFGKVRPGFIRLEKGDFEFVPTGDTAFPFNFRFKPRTNLAVDVGGVFEYYPWRRIFFRFDFGETFNHYPAQTIQSFTVDPATGAFVPFTFTVPAHTRRIFQMISGVGFRF
jgi:hypothetical protein